VTVPHPARPSPSPAHLDRRRRRGARPPAAWGAAPVALALAVAVVVASLAGCRSRRPADAARLPDGTAAQPATVARVVDGDTVVLDVGGDGAEHARLLGVDTPETVKPDHPVECFGPEASTRTAALLPAGTAVLVQRDAEARDRYGRLLVYLWRRADGLFVNRALLADGYARPLSIAPNTARRAELSAASAGARARGAGLWGRCPPPSGSP